MALGLPSSSHYHAYSGGLNAHVFQKEEMVMRSIRKLEFVLPERPILPGDLTPCDQRVLLPMWNARIFPQVQQ